MSKKRAFSLIETAIVLGIVGLVIGGIWVAAAAVSKNRKETRFLEQLEIIISNTRKNFPAATTFKGSDSNILVMSIGMPNELVKNGWGRIVPNDMISPSASYTTPINPWGNLVIINIERPTTSINSVPYPLYISTDFPSRATCVSIGPKIANLLKNERNFKVTNTSDASIATPALANANCLSNATIVILLSQS